MIRVLGTEHRWALALTTIDRPSLVVHEEAQRPREGRSGEDV